MLALPESSSTNPHGHRPGHGGSSIFIPCCQWIRSTVAYIRADATPGGCISYCSSCSAGASRASGRAVVDRSVPVRLRRRGDPAIDQVLTQLDANNDGPYTADYTVLTKFGNITRPANVSVVTAADR